MKLYHIVAKDVVRRKRRVSYAALGVVIGIMTVVGILTVALAGQTRIYAQLEKYGPNLTILPAISNLEQKLGSLSLGSVAVGENYISEQKIQRIQEISDTAIKEALKITDPGRIAVVGPKLFVNSTIGETPVMAVGIYPEEEMTIKTWWTVERGEYLTADSNQALFGSVAADALKINVGDKVNLNGKELTVSGVLSETGANDDYQVFVPMAILQKAFNKEGQVSVIDIRALCNSCPVEVIAAELNKEITGIRAVAVRQVAATEVGMIEKVNNFMLALAGITLAIGLFGVVNTMMSSVHERVKDIGIMRASGASRNQVIKVFIYEAIVIGILGGIFGYITGTGLAYVLGPIIFEGTPISYVPQYFPMAMGLAIFVAVVATVYPAISASRIKVADSFRSL